MNSRNGCLGFSFKKDKSLNCRIASNGGKVIGIASSFAVDTSGEIIDKYHYSYLFYNLTSRKYFGFDVTHYFTN